MSDELAKRRRDANDLLRRYVHPSPRKRRWDLNDLLRMRLGYRPADDLDLSTIPTKYRNDDGDDAA